MCKLLKVPFALLTILGLNSCSDKYTLCESSLNVVFKAGFYDKNGVAIAPKKWDLAYESGQAIITNSTESNFSMPLTSTNDSLVYILKLYPSTVADTFSLVYSTVSQNISEDCGNVNTNFISRIYYTTNNIDSIALVLPVVNTQSAENIKIYY